MIQKGKVNVIIDGQWGSTGKGLLAAYLLHTYGGIDACVCDFMPNAGHTAYIPGRGKFVSRHVPIGVAFGRVGLIGPHAALDLTVLSEEMRQLKDLGVEKPRIIVHPLAACVQEADREAESRVLGRIASTQKGGHAATVRKTMRRPDALLARDCVVRLLSNGLEVADTQEVVQTVLSRGGTVLAETAQGFDLGLNHGTAWPYVTGRDCLVGRVLDNAGASVRDVGCIIGSLRTFPIRVGNTEEGSSGPCYGDHVEMTWADVSEVAGRPVTETTTVTGRTRRVFGFSFEQLRRFLVFCRPDHLFLNFVNYTHALSDDERGFFLRSVARVGKDHGSQLSLLGTGPLVEDVVPYHYYTP